MLRRSAYAYMTMPITIAHASHFVPVRNVSGVRAAFG